MCNCSSFFSNIFDYYTSNLKYKTKQKKSEFIKLNVFALWVIRFLSNLNGAVFIQCLIGIKCDEVKIINAITKSEINFNIIFYKVKLFALKFILKKNIFTLFIFINS